MEPLQTPRPHPLSTSSPPPTKIGPLVFSKPQAQKSPSLNRHTPGIPSMSCDPPGPSSRLPKISLTSSGPAPGVNTIGASPSPLSEPQPLPLLRGHVGILLNETSPRENVFTTPSRSPPHHLPSPLPR
ncbi:hypothetical protein JTE90_023464 [Oedothorax gibbosus]|uniref:Uncharacterized protein n=1 Tax=Oedothorax gibbosus TaxID=931172 RepID=A0AAV6TM66_9ARAC|nr:hypothetical protein JTE90_023464 [Oedothorax gibbosus]